MVAMNKRFECEFADDDLTDALQERIDELKICREFEAWQHRVDIAWAIGWSLCVGIVIGLAVMAGMR